MRRSLFSSLLLLALLPRPARASDDRAPAAAPATTASAPATATASAPATATATTESPAPTLFTLQHLLLLLRDKSPTAAVRQAGIELARADLVAAGAHPNPTLSYQALIGIHDPAYVNGTQHQILVSQPVLIAGQRGARKSAARLGVGAASSRATAELAEASALLRRSFVNLLAAQERIEILTRALGDVERARDIVSGRAQSGVMSRYDVLKLELEARSLAARLGVARAEARDVSARIAIQLGLGELNARAVGSLQTDTPPERDTSSAPELVAARDASQAAQARIDVARRERIPTPVLSAGAQLTSSGYTLAGALGLAFDLPLFDTGKGPIARASAEARLASDELELTRAQLSTTLARARQALADKQHALQEFERDVLSQLPALGRMSEDAYAAGQGTSLDLLDALRTVTEAQTAAVDYREAAALARVELLAATGLSASDLP